MTNYRNYKTRHQPKLNCFWLVLTLICSISQAQSGFESLFNGKDLSGWEGQEDLWKVENGAIVGSTHGVTLEANTFLVWKGEDAGDFHLKMTLRLSGENNSGIMYRAQPIDGVPFGLSGNQLDIHLDLSISACTTARKPAAASSPLAVKKRSSPTLWTRRESRSRK